MIERGLSVIEERWLELQRAQETPDPLPLTFQNGKVSGREIQEEKKSKDVR